MSHDCQNEKPVDIGRLMLHAALNPQTRQLIDKGVFKKMKNTALFINTARGGIVNENDLIAALNGDCR